MPSKQFKARALLVDDIIRGFNLTREIAAELADAMRRDGPMAQVLHSEFFVQHSRLVSQYATLAEQLRASLHREHVPERWRELLPNRLRPGVKYLYYRLSDGEIYGRWKISFDTPI